MRVLLVRPLVPMNSRAEQLRLRIRQLIVSAGNPPQVGWLADRRMRGVETITGRDFMKKMLDMYYRPVVQVGLNNRR